MKTYIIAVVVFLVSCSSPNNQKHYRVVLKHDENGTTIQGSKEDLISYIRGGAEIRIGWGVEGKTHTIEHLSDPIWLSVLDGSEVIAHLDPQVLSQVDWTNLSANYSDTSSIHQLWRVVLTTKGEFDAIWYDQKSNELVKRIPQQKTMLWFARGIKNDATLYSKE